MTKALLCTSVHIPNETSPWYDGGSADRPDAWRTTLTIGELTPESDRLGHGWPTIPIKPGTIELKVNVDGNSVRASFDPLDSMTFSFYTGTGLREIAYPTKRKRDWIDAGEIYGRAAQSFYRAHPSGGAIAHQFIVPPSTGSVLESLVSDAAGYENAVDFADWAEDLGMLQGDAKSLRRAEKSWLATIETTVHLKRMLGADYDRVIYRYDWSMVKDEPILLDDEHLTTSEAV